MAQLFGLLCAPIFGYLSSRTRRTNIPVKIASLLGVVAYTAFPLLRSPEIKDVDGRGGGPLVFLLVALMGISQIGAIVCSLGSLGRGVLTTDVVLPPRSEDCVPSVIQEESTETSALLAPADEETTPCVQEDEETQTRVRLKGSIAGVYSWFGGAAILLLTKAGGYLFDEVANGAPFYMMAGFNGVWFVASLGIDMAREFRRR